MILVLDGCLWNWFEATIIGMLPATFYVEPRRSTMWAKIKVSFDKLRMTMYIVFESKLLSC